MGYPIQTNRCAVVRPRVRLEPKIEDLVRRACFTVASSSLASYGVHPNDIIDHLIHAGLAAANRAERVVEHLDGVAHAVACIRGNSRAWADLATLHGWCLERAAMEQHGAEGGLATRRFWFELRQGTLEAADSHLLENRVPCPRLQWYAGLRPLRHWLADRLFGGIEARLESSQRETLDSTDTMRSLAAPAAMAATAT